MILSWFAPKRNRGLGIGDLFWTVKKYISLQEATLKEAFETKKEGLHTIVVSVGTWLDKEELTNMASYPYQNNVFGVVNANGLSGIKDRLREVICNSKSRMIFLYKNLIQVENYSRMSTFNRDTVIF